MSKNNPVVFQLQTDYIAKMRGRKERYTVSHAGCEDEVLPNVFPPYIDSELIARVMHIEKGDEVLDVGSGSGFIAVTASATARRFVATDINSAAIETIRANAARRHVEDRLTALKTDVFPEHKDVFDVITFNPPFSDHAAADVVERSVWDPGHATVLTFVGGVGDFLKPGGRIYMSWAGLRTCKSSRRSLTYMLPITSAWTMFRMARAFLWPTKSPSRRERLGDSV